MIYWETESGTTINNIFDIFSNLQYNFILKGGNNYPFFPLKRKRFVKIKTEKKEKKKKKDKDQNLQEMHRDIFQMKEEEK
jgi:hypothetical protein